MRVSSPPSWCRRRWPTQHARHPPAPLLLLQRRMPAARPLQRGAASRPSSLWLAARLQLPVRRQAQHPSRRPLSTRLRLRLRLRRPCAHLLTVRRSHRLRSISGPAEEAAREKARQQPAHLLLLPRRCSQPATLRCPCGWARFALRHTAQHWHVPTAQPLRHRSAYSTRARQHLLQRSRRPSGKHINTHRHLLHCKPIRHLLRSLALQGGPALQQLQQQHLQLHAPVQLLAWQAKAPQPACQHAQARRDAPARGWRPWPQAAPPPLHQAASSLPWPPCTRKHVW